MDAIFASRDPACCSRLQLGVSGTAKNAPGTSTRQLKRNEALAGVGHTAVGTTREYFVSNTAAANRGGRDNIVGVDALLRRMPACRRTPPSGIAR